MSKEGNTPQREVFFKDPTGEKHKLRYERVSIYRLEKHADQSLRKVFERMQEGSYASTIDMVWAGLLHSNPKITLAEVCELVTFENLTEATEAAMMGVSPVLGIDTEEMQEAIEKQSDGTPTTMAGEDDAGAEVGPTNGGPAADA